MKRRDFLAASLAALAPLALSRRPAFAAYPDRPVRLIVPRTAGGVIDGVARHWGHRISQVLGNSVYIENIAGGSGTVGTYNAARATADGYSLLLGNTSDIVLTPLQRETPYDPETDFAPASVFAVSAGAIAVHGGLPVKTIQDLIAYCKAHPGKVSYAAVGAGTMSHLIGEQFKQIAGLPDVQHVPYKSGAAAFADLTSGVVQIQGLFITTPTIALHNAGKIRILAAATEKRLTAAPDIPTTAEAGLPGLIAEMSAGILAPQATPASIIDTISTKTRDILAKKDFQETLLKAGFEPVLGSTPDSAAKHF